MNKANLTQIKRDLTEAADWCHKLREYLGEIPDSSRRQQAEAIWLQVDRTIKEAKNEMMNWKIGYPKGKHRIREDQLEAIRQWKVQPYPKPKVRTLAKSLELSPTTVYAVLKKLGWRKAAR